MSCRHLLSRFFGLLVGLLVSSVSFAQLGGDQKSIQMDSEALHAKSLITVHSTYRLHAMKNRGVQLHEFEGADGKVFALAWQGKRHPELSTVLGTHLSEFHQAIAEARAAHRHGGVISTTVGNVHIEMGGHMGAVYGHFWLKDQLPVGMNLNEIR